MDPSNVTPRVWSAKLTTLEDFCAAVRGAEVELTLLSGGRTEWDLLRVQFDRCSIHHARELSHSLSTTAIGADRAAFIVPMGGAPLRVNGYVLREQEMMYCRPGSEQNGCSQGDLQWLAFGVPPADLARVRTALRGSEPPPVSASCQYLRVGAQAWGRVTRELAGAVQAVRGDPMLLQSPQVRRAMEQSLLQSLAQAMDSADDSLPSGERARLSHTQIASRADEYLRDRWDQPVYLADLCEAAGVSERTLRYAFVALYGISPNRYLKCRRLAQSRRVLLESDADEASVSGVASSMGFWNSGRFAVEYRAMFGESPSQTLKRGG